MTMFNEYLNEYLGVVKTFLDAYGISYELAGVIALVALWLILYIGKGLSFFRFLMRWYQRLLVIGGLVALGFWLFYIGREHQIFLDNKTVNDYKALEQVNVSINGGDIAELMPRDRDMRKVVGPEFELKAEIFDDKGEITNTITRKIFVGCSKDIMISLPVLAGGAEDFIVPSPR